VHLSSVAHVSVAVEWLLPPIRGYGNGQAGVSPGIGPLFLAARRSGAGNDRQVDPGSAIDELGRLLLHAELER
jgi:hypothetical protein